MTTMLAESNEEMTTNVDAILPPLGERVIVQCAGFRCVGTCDVNGCWVDAFDNQPLSEVLWFKPLGLRKR